MVPKAHLILNALNKIPLKSHRLISYPHRKTPNTHPPSKLLRAWTWPHQMLTDLKWYIRHPGLVQAYHEKFQISMELRYMMALFITKVISHYDMCEWLHPLFYVSCNYSSITYSQRWFRLKLWRWAITSRLCWDDYLSASTITCWSS